MRRAILVPLVALLIAGCAGLNPHRITEDDPRWDCHTMGNHVCGPTLPNNK